MVYSNDQWVQLPTRDLYDTSIMQMALSAAKDMYDKGLLEIKDFRKEYGDFASPIADDMDWYNKEFGIGDFVAKLYLQGIDPLRSSEGRAAVSRYVNTRNYGELNARKAAIDRMDLYRKNRDAIIQLGLWNEDYERRQLGGLTLEEWDNSKGLWKATSASPYQDLNRRYTHLFDKMELKYDEAETKKTPGWIVETKSKDDMEKILDANLPDLRRNPQYLYDLENMTAAVKRLNPGMSDVDAERLAETNLKREIVDRNWENTGYKRTADPYALKKIDFDQTVALLNLKFKQDKELEQIKNENAMALARAKGEGKPDTIDGFLDLANDYTAAKRKAFTGKIQSEYFAPGSKNAKELQEVYTNLATAVAKGDTASIEANRLKLNSMQGRAMRHFLLSKDKTNNKKTVFETIYNIPAGATGVTLINNIIDNALAVDTGSGRLPRERVLDSAGYELREDGWAYNTGVGRRILTPHQIMINLLNAQSGNGFNIKTTDGVVSRDDIVRKLDEVLKDDDKLTNASVLERANRAGTVDRVQYEGKIISAPNEDGVWTMYAKVKVDNSNWRFWHSSSWFTSPHGGYWVELGPSQTPAGSPTTESQLLFYSSDVEEFHKYGGENVKKAQR